MNHHEIPLNPMNIYENPMSGIDMGSANPPSRGPVFNAWNKSLTAPTKSSSASLICTKAGARPTQRLQGDPPAALVMVKCYLIWIGKRLNIWSAFHSFIISVYGGEMCWQSWPALPCPCHCFFWTSPDWISRSQFWLFCWPNHLGLHVFRSFHVSVWGHPPFFGQPEFGVNSIYFQLPLDQHRYGTTYHL